MRSALWSVCRALRQTQERLPVGDRSGDVIALQTTVRALCLAGSRGDGAIEVFKPFKAVTSTASQLFVGRPAVAIAAAEAAAEPAAVNADFAVTDNAVKVMIVH